VAAAEETRARAITIGWTEEQVARMGTLSTSSGTPSSRPTISSSKAGEVGEEIKEEAEEEEKVVVEEVVVVDEEAVEEEVVVVVDEEAEEEEAKGETATGVVHATSHGTARTRMLVLAKVTWCTTITWATLPTIAPFLAPLLRPRLSGRRACHLPTSLSIHRLHLNQNLRSPFRQKNPPCRSSTSRRRTSY